jgi:hypothetical protein
VLLGPVWWWCWTGDRAAPCAWVCNAAGRGLERLEVFRAERGIALPCTGGDEERPHLDRPEKPTDPRRRGSRTGALGHDRECLWLRPSGPPGRPADGHPPRPVLSRTPWTRAYREALEILSHGRVSVNVIHADGRADASLTFRRHGDGIPRCRASHRYPPTAARSVALAGASTMSATLSQSCDGPD